MIVDEQEILKREAPSGGVWTESSIRAFQESRGINYSNTVYVRGASPYRLWSNDPDFEGRPIVSQHQKKDESVSEIERLKKEIEELKSQHVSRETKVEPPVFNAERHGLHDLGTDKRTKEYRKLHGK